MAKKSSSPVETGYLLALSQVGVEMVVPIGLGVGLDVWLGTLPWITVVGVLLGLFGGIAHLLVIVDRMDKAAKMDPPDPPQESK
jgi:F0F1-type ATP synthase assembly protein I